MGQAILTVKEVAAQLRCSETAVKRMYHAGELGGFRVGRVIRIWAESVTAFMGRGRVRTVVVEKAASPKRSRQAYDYSPRPTFVR